jgi:hypothetical protein
MFTHSKRVIGGKSRSFTEQERDEVYNYYRNKLKDSYNNFKNWGDDIPGVTDYTRRLYENGKAVGILKLNKNKILKTAQLLSLMNKMV